MMTKEQIYERLTPIFRDVFDDDDLVPHAELIATDVEEWDSLAHIRLIVTVESEFGVRFTTPEVNKLENVGDFVGLIQEKASKEK